VRRPTRKRPWSVPVPLAERLVLQQADITTLDVDEGTDVKQGQRIAILEGDDLEAQLRQLHALGRLEDRVPTSTETTHRQPSDARLVLDDEHGLGPVGRPRGRWREGTWIGRVDLAGQVDSEHGPLARLRIDLHVTGKLLHDSVARCQAEPRAFARSLRREERFKYPFLYIRRNAFACVYDPYFHHIIFYRGADSQDSAFIHRVERVFA